MAFVQSTTANIGNARNNPSIWDIILLPFSQLDNQKQGNLTKYFYVVENILKSQLGIQTTFELNDDKLTPQIWLVTNNTN